MRRFLLSCCFAILLPAASLPAADGDQPRIAVLDLEAFLKNASLLTNRYAELQKELDQYNERFGELAGRIKKLETRIGMTEKSDTGYDVLVQDLESAKARLKVAQKLAQDRLEGRKQDMLTASIQETVELLEVYSDEQGIDLVLQTGGLQPEREVPIAELPVLYAAPTRDITHDFLAYANARAGGGDDRDDQGATGSAPVLEGLGEEQP